MSKNYFEKRVENMLSNSDDKKNDITSQKNKKQKKNLIDRVYNNLINNSGIPLKYYRDFLDEFDNDYFEKKTKNYLDEIAEFERFILKGEKYFKYMQNIKQADLKPNSMFIFATGVRESRGTGTGKTELAIIILKEYAKRYAKYFVENNQNVFETRSIITERMNCLDYPYFVNSSNFFSTLKDCMSKNEYDTINSEKRKVKNASILIWDDLGNENKTKWELGILQNIVNYRYEKHLPIVFTSNFLLEKYDNLNPDINNDIEKEEIQKQGVRLYSRLKHMCQNFYARLEGDDKRIKSNRP